jgi:hypothetical protein
MVVTSSQSGGQKAQAGMTLLDAAEVVGEEDSSSLQMECSNHATQTLIGRFDAVIDTQDAQRGCAVNLRDGTAVATTAPGDGPASGVASIFGPVSMISRHTQFGLSVAKFKDSATAVGFVFKGSAFLSRPKQKMDTPVTGGSQIDPDTNKHVTIDSNLYSSVARAYSNLDLSQATPDGTVVDGGVVQARWLAVLRRPTDAQARVELVEVQHQIGATKSLIFAYELKRAATLAEGSGNQDLIARVRAVVAPGPGCGGRPCPPSNICIGSNCVGAPRS